MYSGSTTGVRVEVRAGAWTAARLEHVRLPEKFRRERGELRFVARMPAYPRQGGFS
jgi:hypothetical protein